MQSAGKALQRRVLLAQQYWKLSELLSAMSGTIIVLLIILAAVVVAVAVAGYSRHRENFSYAPRGPPQRRYGLFDFPFSYDPAMTGVEIVQRP